MGVNSSHLGSGANVQTYVGNTSVDNAIIKSNDNMVILTITFEVN
jgi:hypothetical protein